MFDSIELVAIIGFLVVLVISATVLLVIERSRERRAYEEAREQLVREEQADRFARRVVRSVREGR